ncbi:MAG: threonine ammonia-lyase [Pseudohongiellaceae bacterium]
MSITINHIKQAAERLAGVAVRTPLLNSALLDELLQARIFLKAENLQHIGAFKFRGAYNRLVQLSEDERRRGVVAFSSGNHAQGVAYAARLLNIPATIVMPSDAPQIKLDGTRRQGATVREYDRATESREAIADEIANKTAATLVPAFDDPHIIAGQGTCGLELLQQMPELTPDVVMAPCGGGGLMAGFSTAIKASHPDCRIIGVEPEHYDDHFLSHKAGQRTRINPAQSTNCDALMATIPGELTWAINSQTVSEYLLVSEDEISRAVSFAAQYLKLTVESGGAVALAALLAGKAKITGKTVAIVLSGGNIAPDLLHHCLQTHPDPLT